MVARTRPRAPDTFITPPQSGEPVQEPDAAMNNPRTFLLVALFALVYLIWSQWQIDYNPQAATEVSEDAPVADTHSAVPTASPRLEIPHAGAVTNGDATPTCPHPHPTPSKAPSVEPIVVTTDLLRVEIDPRGGNVVSADLLAYPEQPNAAAARAPARRRPGPLLRRPEWTGQQQQSGTGPPGNVRNRRATTTRSPMVRTASKCR